MRRIWESEPLRFDREIAIAIPTARRLIRRFRRFVSAEDVQALQETLLAIANRERLEFVQSMPESEPLREPFLRWTVCALEWRINAPIRAEICRAYRTTRHLIEEPVSGPHTLAEMLAFALSEGPERGAWLRGYTSHAPSLAAPVFQWWQRRRELSERLGSTDLEQISNVGVTLDPGRWLSESRDAFEQFGIGDLPGFLEQSLGADVSLGWPTRLVWRALESWFRDSRLLANLELDPGDTTKAVGASSFLRALARLGASVVDASLPSSGVSFAYSHDPFGLNRRSYGALFALLPLGADFARKNLDIPTSRLRDHRRGVARILLLESRLLALRERLRQSAAEGRSSLVEGYRVGVPEALGFELDARLTGALFLPDDDAAQRFLGGLLAASRYMSLREEYDEDFHRNPRAVERLRFDATLPPTTRVDEAEVVEGSVNLLRLLNEAL